MGQGVNPGLSPAAGRAKVPAADRIKTLDAGLAAALQEQTLIAAVEIGRLAHNLFGMNRLDRNWGRIWVFSSALLASNVGVRAESTGAATFEQQCAACHGLDGKGRTPAGRKIGAKDLTQSRLADDEIARQVSEGSTDKAGKAKMPPFKDQLSPNEIQALVAFVKSLREGAK